MKKAKLLSEHNSKGELIVEHTVANLVTFTDILLEYTQDEEQEDNLLAFRSTLLNIFRESNNNKRAYHVAEMTEMFPELSRYEIKFKTILYNHRDDKMSLRQKLNYNKLVSDNNKSLKTYEAMDDSVNNLYDHFKFIIIKNGYENTTDTFPPEFDDN